MDSDSDIKGSVVIWILTVTLEEVWLQGFSQ